MFSWQRSTDTSVDDNNDRNRQMTIAEKRIFAKRYFYPIMNVTLWVKGKLITKTVGREFKLWIVMYISF